MLVNDTANGGLLAYRAGDVPDIPASLHGIMGISRNRAGAIVITWTGGGTLQTAALIRGPWQDVTTAQSPHSFNPTQSAQFVGIRR